MKRLKEDLDKLEKAEFESLTSESYDEKYQLPLFFAFIFALIELFIGTRRRHLGQWKGRFANSVVWFLVALLVARESAEASPGLAEIWKNNQVAEHLQQEKYLEAQEEMVELLSEFPFEPIFQYNMGVAFVTTEETEKAIQMYTELLKRKPLPPEVEFSTLYNLGFLHSLEGGDIEKALHHYQQALAFNPESKEIKTNIELLLQGGQGGGKGDENDDSDKQNENNEEGEQPKEPQKFTNKQQPNQFNSKEMSKNDVKKILEELKKQEQRIRAKHDRKGGKEADREKNW
jgi:tetratricopeptide (TPR) repeat protein